MNGRSGRFGIAAVGVLLLVVGWVGVILHILRDRGESEEARAERARLAALVLEDHLRRQLVPLDEAAARLARAAGGRAETIAPAALSAVAEAAGPALRALAVIDGDGRVLASNLGLPGTRLTVDLDEVGRSVLLFDPGRAVVGRVAPNPVTGDAALPMARRITRPGGTFGGLVVAYVDPDALFRHLPDVVAMGESTAAVVRSDGWLLAASGAALGPIGSPLTQEGLYDSLRSRAEGVVPLEDGIAGGTSLLAFRHLPELPLIAAVAVSPRTLVGGLSPREALGVAIAAVLALGLVAVLAGLATQARRMQAREAALAQDRKALEERSLALAREKRLADSKTELLETTLAALADGVIVVDGNLRLVTWNNRVPDLLGVPPQLLHVGMRYEDILRALARTGEFGPVALESEVRRRLDEARAGIYATEERRRPNGRVIETRSSPLPGGGFVAVLRDVTARREAEEQLRRGREMAEAASAAKSNFVAIVSHEIRTPMNA
ncbi:MAG: PAS-domain containing protein, partial [Elioraea sp.]|nr:PAS-domain containing protein [Elioraea sp.]